MTEESAFHDLLEQVRAGDGDAARTIFKEYAQRLIGLAHVNLDRAVRQKMDPEDVVQSVFKSFFLRMGKGQFDLANWDGLWSLLVVITLRKCRRKVRDLRRQRHDIRREVAPTPPGPDSGTGWQAVAHDPTPSEAAVLAETVEQLFAGLKERERLIVELHLQGCSIGEIRTEVQRSEYTVRDVLNRVRHHLQSLRDQAES